MSKNILKLTIMNRFTVFNFNSQTSIPKSRNYSKQKQWNYKGSICLHTSQADQLSDSAFTN